MHPTAADLPYPALLSSQQLRARETRLARQLPPYSLMARAGAATARLALAIAPHARHIWVVCGAGNNGGDGLEAAIHLQAAGKTVHLSLMQTGDKPLPSDAAQALQRAQAAGLRIGDQAPGHFDLAIDALWGIGLRADRSSPADGPMLDWLQQLMQTEKDVLCMDTPSGLLADTGAWLPWLAAQVPPSPKGRRFTLSMLTLKPGLFTLQGRDWAGEVWLAPLSAGNPLWRSDQIPATDITVSDCGQLVTHARSPALAHDSHKGIFGDVGVLGGQSASSDGQGMEGAAILAASAALHAGAGRVMLHLLGSHPASPRPTGVVADIMLRSLEAMRALRGSLVCGCGGGSQVVQVIPQALQHPGSLVLDADALNAIAAQPQLQQALVQRAATADNRGITVLTPHPLELARLLGTDTPAIQSDRIGAARQAAQQWQCLVVLKGSGTVVAAPNGRYAINHSGNARLAIGGTGDVLAGCIGAHLAALPPGSSWADGWQPLLNAVWLHGHAADTWPLGRMLTASRLAHSLHRPG
ncbi:NAD(P)H-hydrate dehydratase [Comamonas piscis]|uniref:ADP-dependent (S)-NAD(P)H-hydrate dehydratase n=1 Tax=Comamonas piscis TaxID=1562974 RepID=A0A7G5EJX5_9BURK|nr:NAD(P)H-hydrate dehydratase [Comamonas piscis]QMV74300.1 NAD(P)H-hydrate dehydratase [Comamonas piscis]WSO32746.1 NAD(P)H-hydrate dehydratase [Comamonas piscis]